MIEPERQAAGTDERTNIEGPTRTVGVRLAQAVLIVFVVLAIDQASKAVMLALLRPPIGPMIVTPFFNLRLGFNPGVSFGLFAEALAGFPQAFAILKLLIVAGLIAWSIVTTSRLESVAFALIAGGALGNAVDRLRQGAVTDFLDFHWQGWHWPTFNLSDVAICLGAGIILLSMFRSQRYAASAEDAAVQSSRAETS